MHSLDSLGKENLISAINSDGENEAFNESDEQVSYHCFESDTEQIEGSLNQLTVHSLENINNEGSQDQLIIHSLGKKDLISAINSDRENEGLKYSDKCQITILKPVVKELKGH